MAAKKTRHRQTFECPEWVNRDEHTAPACFAQAHGVLVKACTEARQQVPGASAIRSWHDALFREVAPVRYYAGNVRQDNKRFVCLGTNVTVDGVAGAHYRTVPQLVAEFAVVLHARLSAVELNWTTLSLDEKLRRVATIVGTAVGEFIKIHPFLNGNGRTSRLLWRVLLHRLGLPGNWMSVVRRPGPPYGTVMAQAMRGNYVPAIQLVLLGLASSPPPPALPTTSNKPTTP